jgi:uncharacterized protein involved in copper resistance
MRVPDRAGIIGARATAEYKDSDCMHSFSAITPRLLVATLLALPAFAAHAEATDSGFGAEIGKLELVDGSDTTPLVLDAEMWVGDDDNRFWLTLDSEFVEGDSESVETELLYTTGIGDNWEGIIGLRKDVGEVAGDKRAWFVIGGATELSDTAAAEIKLNAGEGTLELSIAVDHEAEFGEHLFLVTEFELISYSDDDTRLGVRSGPAEAELGLRLHYHIEGSAITPYAGVNIVRLLGQTASDAKAMNAELTESGALIGLQVSF